ncbi:MAG: tRNA 2-thiouridine(34) synthase MnmA [Campylobacter sp.]|nr:tRNA 2-thiouridine(34) synthase MnmA [Campylobacter sp.]
MKVMVALSGGVDSTITAKFLKDEGHDIKGCYMMLHDNPKYHEKNIANVKKIGEFLDIKIYILDLRDKFNKEVYTPFVEIYKEGKTPNPCALCNREIKFGELLEFALNCGCQKLATGHYVCMDEGLLKVAEDRSKDQSYFLANIDPKSLKYILFPLGAKLKSDVKNIANSYPELISIASQKESTEICFVDDTYTQILSRHYNTNLPGNVVDKTGKTIGTHSGYMHYTIGKRRGFTVYGAHDPHFVTSINPEENEITVGLKEDLLKKCFETKNRNTFKDLEDEFSAYVKIRYRGAKIPAVVKKGDFGFKVELKDKVYGIASGQLAVFYDDKERVIASGFIK